jgi:RNA polymerase sigma factor (sigma-70 family)
MEYANIEICVRACLGGDKNAYRYLYEQHKASMYKVCLRYAANRQEAEDFLQEGFMAAFKALPRYEAKGSFEGWLRRIIVGTAIDQLRRKRLKVIELTDQEMHTHPVSEPDPMLVENEVEVQKAMQQLTEAQRTAFSLFVVEGYSHQEIGRLLGIAESSSRSLVARARNLLRTKLSQFHHLVL